MEARLYPHKSESSYILSPMKEKKTFVLPGEFFKKVLIWGLKELSSLKGNLSFGDRNGS